MNNAAIMVTESSPHYTDSLKVAVPSHLKWGGQALCGHRYDGGCAMQRLCATAVLGRQVQYMGARGHGAVGRRHRGHLMLQQLQDHADVGHHSCLKPVGGNSAE